MHEPDLDIVALRDQLRNRAAEAAGLFGSEVEEVVSLRNGLRLPIINPSCGKAFGPTAADARGHCPPGFARHELQEAKAANCTDKRT